MDDEVIVIESEAQKERTKEMTKQPLIIFERIKTMTAIRLFIRNVVTLCAMFENIINQLNFYSFIL